jgi:hypothetical protein
MNMGGYGSGHRITRKSTVEECRALDIARFPVTEFVHQSPWPRVVSWKNYAGETTASVGYTCESCGSGSAVLRLSYTVGRDNPLRTEGPIEVVTTQPYFGGVRWWFICPLTVDGRVCQRRVRKLYLPSGGRYFGCRACYNLTYESVRSHDNRVGRLLRNPDALFAALDSKNLNISLLGVKAFCKLRGFL